MDRLRAGIAWLRRIAPERLLLVILLLVAIALWVVAVRALPRPLQVTALAVGDGDAFLIQTPAGKSILIDGGSRSQSEIGTRVLVPNLRLLGVRKLDALLITHPDSDHLNGLAAVVEDMPVAMVLTNGRETQDAPFQQLLTAVRKREIPLYRVRAGDQLHLGGKVSLRILAPGVSHLSGTPSDDNNNSLVCLLQYRQARMLFTGDLETEGEAALLAACPDLHADILKVAHHGSKRGTTPALLAAVKPTRALISSKGAGGDHPHAEVLQRLQSQGVDILRTDVQGMITLASHGNGWTVETFRP